MQWVKARRGLPARTRWVRELILALWKLARRLPLADRLCVTLAADGHRVRVRFFSYDDLLTLSTDYESCLAPFLPPRGGVAVDAGAFIGRYTLAYARAVGPTGRVVAAEPLGATFRLLEHNVRRNGYDHVRCVPCALGRDDGEVWLAYGQGPSTASTIYPFPRRQKVVRRSLDRLLPELGIGKIDFLKIDVEGAELDVLEGSRTILAASPGARLVIEIHSVPGVVPGGTCRVKQWLLERGYTVAPLRDGSRLFYLAQRQKPAE